MSINTTDTKQNDVSLDEILSSIRSVVLDGEAPNKASSNSGRLTGTANSKKRTSVKSKTPNKAPAKMVAVKTNIAKKAKAKKSASQKQKTKVNNTAKVTPNLPIKPFLLTQIIELGSITTGDPIVSDLSQHKIEGSLYDLVDIMSAMKDELPPEFYDKQDEVVKVWLEAYLPEIVERQVQKEIYRIGQNITKNY